MDASHSDLKTDYKNKHFAYLYPLRPIFERAGIEFDQMIEIIALKSKILNRTEQSQNARAKKKNKKANATEKIQNDESLFSLNKSATYLITSAFIMLYGFMFKEPSTMLSIIFTVGFVMQFLAIVTSFPVLILDTKDYTTLATKPINSKTIAAAKTTIATLYMIFTSGMIYGFTFIPFIAKGYWSVLPVMLVSVILSNLICVALSYLLYGLVLKFYDGEKLKDLISFFQIFLTIFLMVGYQIVAQLQRIVNISSGVSFQWWHLLCPPMWLSNFSAIFIGPSYILPGLLSGAMILGLLILHFAFTGRFLEENLSKMLGEGDSHKGQYSLKLAFQERIARLLYKNKQDQAFFILGYSISSNDRKMKQTIYPLYVSMLILPALMIFNAWQSHPQALNLVFAENNWLIFTLYFAGISLSGIVLYTKRTEKPLGAWIYETLPIESKRRAFKAVALNLILRYVVVPMFLFTALLAYFSGLKNLPSLALIMLFTIFMTFVTLKTEKIDWPFSYDLTFAESKKGTFILINLACTLVFVALHVMCQYLLVPYGVPILTLLTGIVTWLLWRNI